MSANQKLFALLIDGDNVSPTLITQILDKLKEYGEPFICRVFANRTSIVAWDAAVLKHSLGSIRVPNNTKGMNAVDISIVIAAMDLHYNRPELTGFCIVSSDGDFTELAIYLKERHKFVLGIGDERTPDSLANACSKFVNIKDLPKAQATTPPPHATKPAIPKSPSPPTPAAKVTTPKAPAPKSATPKAPTLKAPAPKASVSKAPVHIATPKLPAPKVSVPKASTPTKPPTSKMPTPKAPAPKTSALKEAEPKTPMPQLPAPKVPTPQPPITAKPVPETPKASTLTSEAWFTRPYYNTLKTQGGWIQGGETSEDMISLDDRFEMSFVRAYDNSSKGEGGWVSLREIREGMKNMDSEFELREYQSTRLFADKAKSLAALYPGVIEIDEQLDKKPVVHSVRIHLAIRSEFDRFCKAYNHANEVHLLKGDYGWIKMSVINEMLWELYQDKDKYNPLYYRGIPYGGLLDVAKAMKRDYPDAIEIREHSTGHSHIRIKG